MKKSLKKQAVFPVLMLLVVTALALIGSSFAWFAMSNVASVSTFNSTVEQGSTGLMISANGTDFVGTVTLGDGTGNTQLSTSWINPGALHQVSTTDGVNFFEGTIVSKDQEGKVSTITSSADLSHPAANMIAAVSTVADGKTAHFIVFDLYFQIDVAHAHLYLNEGTEVTSLDGKTSEKAIRVAFLSCGNSSTTSGAIALGYTSAPANIKIWKPVAEDPNQVTYGLCGTNGTPFNAYSSVPSYAVSNNELTGNTIVPTTDLAEVEPASITVTPIANLSEGYNKVRVLVWLEGQDTDCVVNIARGALSVSLNFFAAEYTE